MKPSPTPAPPPVIFLAGLPAPADAIVRGAARLAFPEGKIQAVATPREIPVQADARIVVVLGENALRSLDGAPPWPAVALGRETRADVETVPPDEWNEALLARVLGTALLRHELAAENRRLRGDLKTVARRIAHDLRTPVSCIITSCEVLKGLSADDDAGLGEMTQSARDSAAEISRLVDRMSFVLKASVDATSPQSLTMGEPVAAVLHRLEPALRAAGARVVPPDSWPTLPGVAPWLEAIWTNLIENALQHGGRAVQIRLGWEVQGGDCRFWICDSGPGVPAARAAGLFSAFEDLHFRTSVGLGLSIVQRLVALQGGRCGYERNARDGTCFHFTLPAA